MFGKVHNVFLEESTSAVGEGYVARLYSPSTNLKK